MQITRKQKEFVKIKIKNLGDYYGLYVQIDALLLAIIANFQNIFFKIYELDLDHFLSASGLT